MIQAYWNLLRPSQYIKNSFIFLPLFFGQKITILTLLWPTIFAFICFCLTASSVYIFNDYRDLDADRQHPKKKFRPLASGQVSIPLAFSLMGGLGGIGMVGAWLLQPQFFYLLLLYFGLNLAYSWHLKHIALLDIFIIAVGFVLRIFAGGVVSGVSISIWIVLMTFLLALFLALAKRRDDVLLVQQGAQVRKAIDGYNLEFVNAAMLTMAPVILVAYISYTVSPEVREHFHTENLYLTALFVVLGVLRYLQITFVEHNSGNPTEILLKDRFLQLTVIAWLLAFIVFIY